jgi:hypothetical protein
LSINHKLTEKKHKLYIIKKKLCPCRQLINLGVFLGTNTILFHIILLFAHMCVLNNTKKWNKIYSDVNEQYIVIMLSSYNRKLRTHSTVKWHYTLIELRKYSTSLTTNNTDILSTKEGGFAFSFFSFALTTCVLALVVFLSVWCFVLFFLFFCNDNVCVCNNNLSVRRAGKRNTYTLDYYHYYTKDTHTLTHA